MDDVGKWQGMWPVVVLVAGVAMGCAEGVGTDVETLGATGCVLGAPNCPDQEPPGAAGHLSENSAAGSGGALAEGSGQDETPGGAGAEGALAGDPAVPSRCGGLDADGDGALDCDDACPHNANLVEACEPGQMLLQIDGSQVSSALEDFPLLVRESDNAALALHADMDGMDIYFEDADGTALKHSRLEGPSRRRQKTTPRPLATETPPYSQAGKRPPAPWPPKRPPIPRREGELCTQSGFAQQGTPTP